MMINAEDITMFYRSHAGRNLWEYIGGLAKRKNDSGSGDSPGLKNITCSFGDGVNIVMGPNGSGKTTLLEILAGLVPPQSGCITFAGKVADQPALRRVSSYLPQTFGLYTQVTARDMLCYIALLKGIVDRHVREQCIEHVLQQMGLSAIAERKIEGYSRGMRQKVGIAQALLGDPSVLILDEPTTGLDPEERNKLRGLLAKLGQERVIIWASSLITDICCADRVLILDQGRQRFWGTPAELASCAQLPKGSYLAEEEEGETEPDHWAGVLERGYQAVLAARVSR